MRFHGQLFLAVLLKFPTFCIPLANLSCFPLIITSRSRITITFSFICTCISESMQFADFLSLSIHKFRLLVFFNGFFSFLFGDCSCFGGDEFL